MHKHGAMLIMNVFVQPAFASSKLMWLPELSQDYALMPKMDAVTES